MPANHQVPQRSETAQPSQPSQASTDFGEHEDDHPQIHAWTAPWLWLISGKYLTSGGTLYFPYGSKALWGVPVTRCTRPTVTRCTWITQADAANSTTPSQDDHALTWAKTDKVRFSTGCQGTRHKMTVDNLRHPQPYPMQDIVR